MVVQDTNISPPQQGEYALINGLLLKPFEPLELTASRDTLEVTQL